MGTFLFFTAHIVPVTVILQTGQEDTKKNVTNVWSYSPGIFQQYCRIKALMAEFKES